MKRKHLTETPVCPRERLVIISYTTSLSFSLERIGPLAAIIITVFYLLVLCLFVLPNTPENLFASIYSESLIKTACQHLLLLVGFDTLIYRKYYDTPPILVGHQPCRFVRAAGRLCACMIGNAMHALGVHSVGAARSEHGMGRGLRVAWMAASGWAMGAVCLGTDWRGSGRWLAINASASNGRAPVGIGKRESEW
jgi:hypothetical protein